MGSRDIDKYVVVYRGIFSNTTHNKAMPTLSYRVKVSRYIATCISDHLTTYVLQLIDTSLIVYQYTVYNTKASTLSRKPKSGPYWKVDFK